MAKVNRPKAEQCYRTPPELLAAVERRFGKITFDLACTTVDAVAPLGYAIDAGADALQRDWRELAALGPDFLGWCNPMWGKSRYYAAKCAEAGAAGLRVLLNCPLAPDARWYAKHVHGKALVLACCPRIPYLKPDGLPACVGEKGKPLGINRPVMVAAYGFSAVGFEPWEWAPKKSP